MDKTEQFFYPAQLTEDDERFFQLLDPDDSKGFVTIKYFNDCDEDCDNRPRPLVSVKGGYLLDAIKELAFSNEFAYFYTRQRSWKWGKHSDEFISRYTTVILDLDDHTPGCMVTTVDTARSFIDDFAEYFRDHGFRPPNALVATGRGYHLVWFTEPLKKWRSDAYTRVTRQYIALAEAFCESIDSRLVVDHTCSNREQGLVRMPGCARRKYDMIIPHALVMSDERMDLVKESRLWPDIEMSVPSAEKGRPKSGKKGKRDKKVKASLTLMDGSGEHEGSEIREITADEVPEEIISGYKREKDPSVNALGWSRVRWLKQLAKLRAGEMTRCRAMYLFYLLQSMCAGGYSAPKMIDRIIEANRGFKEPLTRGEIKNLLVSGLQNQYTSITTKRIMADLNVTAEERKQLDLTVLTGAHYGRDKRTREKREARDRKVVELYEAGVSRVEIGKRCGLSRPTVIRILDNAGYPPRSYNHRDKVPIEGHMA